MNIYYTYTLSPIGTLLLVANDHALIGLYMENHKYVYEIPVHAQTGSDLLKQACQQIREYFEGLRQDFTIPLQLQGTLFQQSVWNELSKIPFGATISYSHLAKRLNKPEALRAVGLANGKNPISIVVPCHRVIGTNGTLTGYAGGIERKQWLLEHERKVFGTNTKECSSQEPIHF